jgi:hypothetical protein
MSIRGLIRSIAAIFRSPFGRLILLTAYYLLIIAALVLMYGEGDFSSSGFVYQGF